jgi:cation diffusion facilitator family transporter
MAERSKLTRYAWLSVGAALVTMALKIVAWKLTGSVGLLSDAIESLVNLGAALVAVWTLHIAAQPPDEEHAFGHGKAEYFSSGAEGMLIFAAALCIIAVTLPRLLHPLALEQTTVGLLISGVATLVNFVVARVLGGAGQAQRSIALQADAAHLMTDVYTSVGVIAGVALVALTGWTLLDPLVALAVALNILWTGARLLRESADGLMDVSWPAIERDTLIAVLEEFRARGIDYHALRTRRAGQQRFASVHVLVPGAWSVQQGHDLLEEIEQRIAAQLAPVTVLTHLEPIEDPAAYADVGG